MHRARKAVMNKHCYGCDETKPINECTRCKQNTDGLKALCKKCRAVDQKMFYDLYYIRCESCNKKKPQNAFDNDRVCSTCKENDPYLMLLEWHRQRLYDRWFEKACENRTKRSVDFFTDSDFAKRGKDDD